MTPQYRCFPVNFEKFLKTLIEHLRGLLPQPLLLSQSEIYSTLAILWLAPYSCTQVQINYLTIYDLCFLVFKRDGAGVNKYKRKRTSQKWVINVKNDKRIDKSFDFDTFRTWKFHVQKQPTELLHKKGVFKFHKACNFVKKRLWHRCFPVNFVRFLRITFVRTPPEDCFCMLTLYLLKATSACWTRNAVLNSNYLLHFCIYWIPSNLLACHQIFTSYMTILVHTLH